MRFVSIGQKIFVTLIVMLGAAFALVTVLTLQETERNLELFKDKQLGFYEGEFDLILTLQSQKFAMLISHVLPETASVAPYNDIYQTGIWPHTDSAGLLEMADLPPDLQIVPTLLNRLQMSGEILGYSLHNEENVQLHTLPNQVVADLSQQQPYDSNQTYQVWCATDCFKISTLRIALGSDIYHVYLYIPIVSILPKLEQSTTSNFAIGRVMLDAKNVQDFAIPPSTYSLKAHFVEQLIMGLDDDYSLSDLTTRGVIVAIADKYYYFAAKRLNLEQREAYYLLINKEVSDLYYRTLTINSRVITGGTIFFVLCSFVFYIMNVSHKRRLKNLVERFPLINKQDYKAFKKTYVPPNKMMEDEIDQLNNAANALVDKLISMKQKIEEERAKLKQMAMYDDLTHLPNRNMLIEHLDHLIIKHKRHGTKFAVLLMDVDDFKKVNDGHGHTAGDTLLKKVASRLQTTLRAEDIVCRFGGDEFVLVAENIADLHALSVFGQKILKCFAEPVFLGGVQFYVTASLGLTLCTSHLDTSEELLRQADTAMYKAKETKGNSLRIYDAELNRSVIHKIELEREAHKALENDNFYLALQPLIDLRSNFVVGFEALLRWRHPEQGLISPAEFIPILEKSSFMVQLDYYIIERSLKVLQILDGLGYEKQYIAINLSASQFLDPKLLPFLQKMLTQYRVDPQRIEFEITETTLASDFDVAFQIMKQLRKLGIRLAIDDFGTGYSSLNYLRSMPVDKIKIDATFVKGMLENITDKQIIQSTIAMSVNMNKIVVAEGIETLEQMTALRDMGCNVGQGFYIAMPIPEHQLAASLPKIILDNVWIHELKLSEQQKYFN